MTDPTSRDFPLSALTVIIAQVGDEYPDTYDDTESVTLPLLRANRVRLVQVARPALTIGQAGRYLVLDDSTGPQHLVRAGPVRLSDELTRNGTIAQVSNRRCSLRWKGEVLDAWIADHIPAGFTHAIGYAANETRRIDRDRVITRHSRRPVYPLHEWGWTRATSRAFLRDVTGRTWGRSCCGHCPFQSAVAGRDEWAQRWRDHPAAAVQALRLEYAALALNPRMRLFGATAAWDLATTYHLDTAQTLARRHVDAGPWALYEVRRTITGPSRAMRSVRVLAEGDSAHILQAFPPGLLVRTDRYGIRRAWLRHPGVGYPRSEHLLVMAPAGITAKQRPSFESARDAVAADAGGEPFCGPG